MPSERIDPNMHILMAVSDPKCVSTLKQSLEEFQLKNLEFVKDGYKAVHKGRFQLYSLIFVDAEISKMKAVKVVSSIREHGKSVNSPILFSCTAEQEKEAGEAKYAGATDILHKPIESDELRNSIEKVLDRFIVTKAEEEKQEKEYLEATESSVERGKKLLAQGNFDGAEAAFEEAMVTGGGSLDVFVGLAEVYLFRGDKDSANQVLVEAERIDPQAPDRFRAGLGRFLERGEKALDSEDFENAKREFQAVTLMDPQSLLAWAGLWKALFRLGSEGEAEEAFKSAMVADAASGDLHVYNRMGIYARRFKDFDRALRAFDRALSLDPEDPVLHYNKSLVFVVQEKFQEALELVEQALKLDSDFEQAVTAKKKIQGWVKRVAV